MVRGDLIQRILEFDLSSSKTLAPKAEIYAAACQDSAEGTGANRVSIWKIETGTPAIRCHCYYNAGTGEISEGQILYKKDQPSYFEAIMEHHFIVAPHARTHPITSELNEKYFVPNDIYSLLDFIIHRDFDPVGVICCKNAHSPIKWTDQHVSVLRQVSSIISFYQEQAKWITDA